MKLTRETLQKARDRAGVPDAQDAIHQKSKDIKPVEGRPNPVERIFERMRASEKVRLNPQGLRCAVRDPKHGPYVEAAIIYALRDALTGRYGLDPSYEERERIAEVIAAGNTLDRIDDLYPDFMFVEDRTGFTGFGTGVTYEPDSISFDGVKIVLERGDGD